MFLHSISDIYYSWLPIWLGNRGINERDKEQDNYRTMNISIKSSYQLSKYLLLTANLSAMPPLLLVVFFAEEKLDHEFSVPCLESSYDALVQRLQNGCCVGWEELELNMAKAKFMNNR